MFGEHIRYRYDPRDYDDFVAFATLVNLDSTMAPHDRVRINGIDYDKNDMFAAYIYMKQTRNN